MPNLPEDLYDYQKEDVQKILSIDNALNLSQMGTGKTPVALGVHKLGEYKKVLVVCPTTLKLEWARQILAWCNLEVGVARQNIYTRMDDLFMKDSPFFIVNYESFRSRRHTDILNMYPFDLVILDEAHKVRNHLAQMTKGLKTFVDKHNGTKVLAMTGSPIVNNPMDLFTVLSLLKPDQYKYKDRWEFLRKYCFWESRGYGIKVTGTKNMDELRAETSSFTVRHTKQEVLPYLPEKYYRTVILDMPPEQREAYNSMEKDLFVLLDEGEKLKATSVFAQLIRLRQLNLDPHLIGADITSSKTEFLEELIDDTDEKMVVFSCFETYIRYLHEHVLKDVLHVVITGKETVEERMSAVNRFQEDPSIKIALGTVQSMGEGITLTAASNVVLMDRWWNPSVNTQAVDRLHRIGQKSSVQVIIPINDKSIDSSLSHIIDTKQEMSDAYLGDNQIIKEVLEDLRRSR